MKEEKNKINVEADKKPEKAQKKSKRLSSKEEKELRQKAAERDDYQQKWMQVHAEYENTRKRLEKEKSNHIRFANEDLISQLISLVDNFDMAIGAMKNAEDKEAVMDGICMVSKEFHRILEGNGVEKIKTVGEEFDPNVHEAVFMEETDKYPEGAVVGEVRGGYMLNERLLRPAQVKIAKAIEHKEEEEDREGKDKV